jgi:anti-sigma factor RsiW
MNALPPPCPERELLLHGLADGELDAANALAIEGHLRSCEGCAKLYAEILRHKKIVNDPALRFHATPRLRANILSAMAEVETSVAAPQTGQIIPLIEPRRWSMAAAAFSALALAASLILFVSSPVGTPAIDGELAAAHVRSLLAAHLTDVTSTDRHTVKPWFLGKLGYAPPVIDLKPDDYPLIGGRLDYIDGQPVAAIVYKRRGHIINLFVRPIGHVKSTSETINGYQILSWTRGGFDYSAVSDLDMPGLRQFQHDLDSALP